MRARRENGGVAVTVEARPFSLLPLLLWFPAGNPQLKPEAPGANLPPTSAPT